MEGDGAHCRFVARETAMALFPPSNWMTPPSVASLELKPGARGMEFYLACCCNNVRDVENHLARLSHITSQEDDDVLPFTSSTLWRCQTIGEYGLALALLFKHTQTVAAVAGLHRVVPWIWWCGVF